MAETNEAKLPLTAESVQAWACENFPRPFGSLPRLSRLTWIGFDETRFVNNRAAWRSIGRSSHKQLLVIGAYEPGSETVEEPTDRVVAHLHADEAAITFHRIAETAEGAEELLPVNSTSAVAFHAPFCDVGDATGGSDAIHRVSALIRYFFLAARHVDQLVRSKLDPTMFTRNFRGACLWIENRGERPTTATPSRGSGTTTTPSQGIATRLKRFSAIFSPGPSPRSSAFTPKSPSAASHAPTIRRSATDSMSTTSKRERDDQAAVRPKRRRTLSEQIPVSKLHEHGLLGSPRAPPPARVHQALTDRIKSLKAEKEKLEGENGVLQTDLGVLERRLTTVEIVSEQLQSEMRLLRERVEKAEQGAAAATAEVVAVRKGLLSKQGKAARKWGT